MSPEFVLADIDIGVPVHSVTADIHLDALEEGGVRERLEHLFLKQRGDVVNFGYLVAEKNGQITVVDGSCGRNFRDGCHDYSKGGNFWNS